MKDYATTMLMVGLAFVAASIGVFASKMDQGVATAVLVLGTSVLTGAFTLCVMNVGIGLGVELSSGEEEDNEEHGAL